MRSLLKKYFSPQSRIWIKARLPRFAYQKYSYSQTAEDLLVVFILDLLCGNRPKTYIDIGANHPYQFSNTALLYLAGGRGILVEPDPDLANLLRIKRPRDKVLEFGVHFSGADHGDFFRLDPPTLNTFSREEMERYVTSGHKLLETRSVRLRGINDILAEAGPVDFMNLDIEGLDKSILEMIDWAKFRPTCICVETLTYEVAKEPVKLSETIDFLEKQGYRLYADTYINSIFVDRATWLAHWVKN